MNIYGVATVLFFSFSVGAINLAKADPWAFYGNGVAGYETTLAPSGSAGESAFSIPQLQLGVSHIISEKTEFNFLIDAGETRDTVSGQHSVKLNEFVISTRKNPESAFSVSIGLLPKVGFSVYRQLWEKYFVLEKNANATVQGALPSHDLGLQISRAFLEEKLTATFQITNGEGEKSGETGRRKDAHFVLDYSVDEQWGLSLLASDGSYDNIDPTKNSRDRLGAEIRFLDSETKPLQGGSLQILESRDAVDGMPGAASGATLIPGEIAVGRTAQAWLVGGRDPLSWFLAYSWQDPDIRIQKNAIIKNSLGLNCQWEENFMSSLQFENVHFEENHSPGIRDAQQARFLTRIDFD